MQWIKLLEARAGKAIGTVYEEEDAAATMLLEFKKAEKTEKPAAAKAIDDEVAKGVDALVDAAVEQFDQKFTERTAGRMKGNAEKRHAALQVGKDRESDNPTDGFKSLAEFSRVVRSASLGHGIDERLDRRLKANGASEGVNADGGYTVPVQYATTVWDDIMAQDSLMKDCFLIPMNSASIKLPRINYLTQGAYGVTAYWEGEGQTISTSKPKFAQPQLTLNKLAAMVPVTSELLEDGIAIESIITKLAGEALTFKLNDAIFNGTGTGMPTGIIAHASTASVAKESSQSAAGIIALNVIKMRQSFYGNRKRAKWYANQDTESQLLTIADPGGRYLYFAPGTFANNPSGEGSMLGSAVQFVMNCQTMGTKGDIIYADLNGYALGYKTTGVNQAMSMHLYFATDELAYRWTMRVDGRPMRDTTLAAANGSATYSSAVVLATRP